jgi:hypothetical protein
VAGAEETDRPGIEARRLQALSRANEIRTLRAEVKRALRRGDLQIADLLVDPPSCIETASLAELLLAVRGLGKVRVRRLLATAEIPPRKRIDSLTERQREALLPGLTERNPKRR